MCARHIYARWGKKFRDEELKMHFWICARTTNQPQFLKEIETLRFKNEEAYNYLLEHWDPKYWSLAFYSDFSKCDVIDNNMCETFNGVIIEARCKPIISMLEDIRIYIMRRLVKNRQYGRNWKTEYGPRILSKLEKYRKLSTKWEVDWNGGRYHEVFWENVYEQVKESFSICLSERTCSCRFWDISGVPCQHAITAIQYEGDDPVNYLNEYYKREVYLKAYEHMLHPVKGPMFWPKRNVEQILPPHVKKVPGRPKKERKREELEGRKRIKLSRIGRIMRCSICHQEGHNKRKCLNFVETDNSKVKYMN